jgi:hypothetical protein
LTDPVQTFDLIDRHRIEEKLPPLIRMQFVPVFDRNSQNSQTVLYMVEMSSPAPHWADSQPETLPRSNRDVGAEEVVRKYQVFPQSVKAAVQVSSEQVNELAPVTFTKPHGPSASDRQLRKEQPKISVLPA